LAPNSSGKSGYEAKQNNEPVRVGYIAQL